MEVYLFLCSLVLDEDVGSLENERSYAMIELVSVLLGGFCTEKKSHVSSFLYSVAGWLSCLLLSKADAFQKLT